MKSLKIVAIVTILSLSAGAARPAERHPYPLPGQARVDLARALKTAAATHKRVLLDFGGNWCPDCLVLNIYFHNPQNLPILTKSFVLVDVNIGEYDANLDLAQRYGVPLKKGVPALAVLSDRGKLLYTQKQGEFEAMSRMDPSSVTRFLMQWRPRQPGCSMMAVNC